MFPIGNISGLFIPFAMAGGTFARGGRMLKLNFCRGGARAA